jgi:hypothetical protein
VSIQATIVQQITVVETEGGEFVDPLNNTTTTNGLNETTVLNASSTPPATKQSSGRVTLSGGVATLDLTSLPDKNGTPGAVTFLGLKVNSFIFHNPSAANITIVPGASNGYTLLGTAFSVTIRPGETLGPWKGADLAPDVASGAKTLDFSGTLAQQLEYHLVAG